MSKKVVKWVSDDGTEFETEREAIIHDLLKIENEEIRLYCEQNFPVKKRKEYQRILEQWNQSRRLDMEDDNVEVVKVLQPDNLFATVPQGSTLKPPANYMLDDEALDALAFNNATRI